MGKKNDDFEKVMRGVKGKNPYTKEREDKERKKAKAVYQAASQKGKKHSRNQRRDHGGDDVIDTGMFG